MSMTDQELLELAAKAAGLDYRHADGEIRHGDAAMKWNPLANDGAALRLAVKLRMEIHHNRPEDRPLWVSVRGAPVQICSVREFTDEQMRCSVTRAAIVFAAAEIGRAMK